MYDLRRQIFDLRKMDVFGGIHLVGKGSWKTEKLETFKLDRLKF